jgi:hypothetical protein
MKYDLIMKIYMRKSFIVLEEQSQAALEFVLGGSIKSN